jgi:hypothetical protein
MTYARMHLAIEPLPNLRRLTDSATMSDIAELLEITHSSNPAG